MNIFSFYSPNLVAIMSIAISYAGYGTMTQLMKILNEMIEYLEADYTIANILH